MKFKAHGKLLISGEYAVLDGAESFAIPTKFGQSLEVKYIQNSSKPSLLWEAFLDDGSLWFLSEFELASWRILNSSDEKLTQKLKKILQAVESLNPEFFRNQHQSIQCKTQLEFPKDWGLGSSSTLVALLSLWTKTDAFELNKLTFNTSGYDIACAFKDKPILYSIRESSRKIEEISFSPEFLDKLYFVYLNQKQDTQRSVSEIYKNLAKDESWISEISVLTHKMINASHLEEFETYINQHENLISQKLKIPKVKDLYFSDYSGSVKSLGAWGGDFVLITAKENFHSYLKSKGYSVIYSFGEMIFQK